MSSESTPSAAPNIGYDQLLVEANGLRQNNFQKWLFHPGMLFNAPQKWWGDLGPRDFPHEGIDFCLFRNSAGQAIHLDERNTIPAMADRLVAMRGSNASSSRIIQRDFLISLVYHSWHGG